MNYQETLQYLYQSVPMFQQIGAQAYKEGLETTHQLDQYFGNPHKEFRTIHVAGTNGKGSCSHTLAAILQAAGYRVGLYTSPHLIDFRERIRINGEMIPETEVVEFVEKHRAFFEPLHPSFFELTTAMAFRYFASQKVDVAVIEVGLGGRLDCTNIIQPDLCVITNISLDHVQFLGNTLEAIAAEKAGIIKKRTPVVIGEATGGVKTCFIEKARQEEAPICFAEEAHPHLQIDIIPRKEEPNQPIKSYYCTHFVDTNTAHPFEAYGELSGECQKKNGRTIYAAARMLQQLNYHIEEHHIKEGLEQVVEKTHLMGRWQVLQQKPTLVCDTGHNVAGLSEIVKQLNLLKAQKSYRQLHLVIGMMQDKDVAHVLELLPNHATYYLTEASVTRTLKAAALKEKAAAMGIHGEMYGSVIEAVRAALEKSLPEDLIFVGGSNFIVADLLAGCDAIDLH